MVALNAVTLMINGLALALALGFLIIVVWHGDWKERNQFFVAFLVFTTLWNIGSLFVQFALLAAFDATPTGIALSILELGFTGSSIAIYILTTVLVGAQSRRFRLLAFSSLGLVVAYRIFLIVTNTGPYFDETRTIDELLTYRLDTLFIIFYLFFGSTTVYLIWRNQRKIRSTSLRTGIFIFVVGQGLSVINPELAIASFSTSVSSIGALMVSFSFLQQEIIIPLSERRTQVEAMHRVSLAISSRISLNRVLGEIASQATGWLEADGTAILLAKNEMLTVETVFNLPSQIIDTTLPFGHGVAGTVAQTRKSVFLEAYERDWSEEADFPLAKETFGSVICVPLLDSNEIIGVLLVVAGRQGRLFDHEDVYLLELLGAQAAVAITQSRLFAEQRALAEQLETVLTSTENPVIAVDRHFRLIFSNPAAQNLFGISEENRDQFVADILPSAAFPIDMREALRVVLRKRSYVYEIVLDGKVYLCHLATLGDRRIAGWVAVLNDVTELKELDRLKSEMVRMASHDLKNPLMGAMAYVELLKDDLVSRTPEVSTALSTIEHQLERMLRIISGILDLERIRLSSEMWDLCDVDGIVQGAVDEIAHLARHNAVELAVDVADDLPSFLGDGEQFQRVLVNLLENAIKFTLTKDGIVEIAAYEEDRQIVFRVKDNGVGIPASVRDRVFDRFYRAGQSGVEHITGSGLGLSLVKSIVEHHQGKVWLTSEEGVGTTFFVAVPVVE